MATRAHVSKVLEIKYKWNCCNFTSLYYITGNTVLLEVDVIRIGQGIALVNITNPIEYPDQRTLIGYQFLHMEDPYGNATKYGYHPCDDR